MFYYSEKQMTYGICPTYTCPVRRKTDACVGKFVYIPSEFISVGPVESSYFLSMEIDFKLSHVEA
jgi:hypothetical protein